MAKSILVPLGQGEGPEAVLPLVADIARGSGGSVRLLHVAPIPRERVAEGGRLVAVVAERGPVGAAHIYRKVAGAISGRPLFDAGCRLLPGFAKPQKFVF